MLRKAVGEAVPPRPRLRVSPLLRLSLCEPIGERPASSSQQIAEDPDAARRLTEHPRALSGEAAGMHWRTYGRLFNKAAAAQERWSALERDYMRRHYPGVLRDESVGGR